MERIDLEAYRNKIEADMAALENIKHEKTTLIDEELKELRIKKLEELSQELEKEKNILLGKISAANDLINELENKKDGE